MFCSLWLVVLQVWDYVRDGYVHRLIRSKTGGKLIEVPTPGAGEGSGTTGTSAGASKCDEEKCDDETEVIMASKLDAIAFEYNHLLTAQLESQRQYFEVRNLWSLDSDVPPSIL